MNGETDDEDMEDGETGFDDGSAQVRHLRDQGQPTTHEPPRAHDHASTVQIMVQVLCDGTRRERTAQEIRCSRRIGGSAAHVNGLRVSWRGTEDCVGPVLVIRERRHKMTWAVLFPRKGTEFSWIVKRAVRFIDQLGHNRVTLRCENEPSIEALAREIGQARQWEKASPTRSSNVRWASLPARPGH